MLDTTTFEPSVTNIPILSPLTNVVVKSVAVVARVPPASALKPLSVAEMESLLFALVSETRLSFSVLHELMPNSRMNVSNMMFIVFVFISYFYNVFFSFFYFGCRAHVADVSQIIKYINNQKARNGLTR